jgi:hypothetical protein
MSETWVDVPRVEMAPPNTWHTLPLNALLDVKNQLLDKMHMARGKPMYLKPLNEAMARLDVLIAQKLLDPRGSN